MKFKGPTEKQAKILWSAVTGLGIAVILALVASIFVALGWVAMRLSSVLIPLVVAGIIAYLIDPVVKWVEEKGVSRLWSILSVFVMAILLQLAFLLVIAPMLVRDTRDLTKDLPNYKQRSIEWYQEFVSNHSIDTFIPETFRNYIPWLNSNTNQVDNANPSNNESSQEDPADTTVDPETNDSKTLDLSSIQFSKIADALWKGVGGASKWAINSIDHVIGLFGILAGFALVPVYVFYFLSEKTGIRDNWTRYLPVQDSWIKEEIVFVLHSINDALIVFFRGQVLVAGCLGILLMIGFSIIGLKFAVLLGFIAGILSIVPYLGVMLSLVPALMISFLQTGSWQHPLLTVGVFVLVQMAEGLYISPKIIGDRVGMHPLTVIIAIMVGTTLMGGIIGGVLAIPLTAALRTVMFRYIWKPMNLPHEKRKELAETGEENPEVESSDKA